MSTVKPHTIVHESFIYIVFLRFYLFIYLFLERGDGREKERGRNISLWLPLTHPQTGAWPTTQACALTGNRTKGPLDSQTSAQFIEPH